jgi:hypothetical protein
MHFITMVVLKEESLSNLRKVVCVFMLQGTAYIVTNLGTEEQRWRYGNVSQKYFSNVKCSSPGDTTELPLFQQVQLKIL